jgi:hypothetical protein
MAIQQARLRLVRGSTAAALIELAPPQVLLRALPAVPDGAVVLKLKSFLLLHPVRAVPGDVLQHLLHAVLAGPDHAAVMPHLKFFLQVITAAADADGVITIVETVKSRDLAIFPTSLAAILTVFPTTGRTLWKTGIIRTLVAFLSQHPNEASKTVRGVDPGQAGTPRGTRAFLQEIYALGGLNVAKM